MGKKWEPKSDILFSKNHITITKTECKNNTYFCYYEDVIIDSWFNKTSSWHGKHYIPTKTITETKESPLGFVYTKKKTVKGHWEYGLSTQNSAELKRPVMKSFNIYLSDYVYNVAYPIKSGRNPFDTEIGVDMRPWDIIDNVSMPDHFITDLFNVLNNIVDDIRKNNVVKKINNNSVWPEDWDREKFIYDLYVDIFGNHKGPRHQTNDEKIVSHGFDLKTSFRKPKEN